MKLYHRILIPILLSGGITLNAQEVWKVEECDISENLNAVHFIDNETGWIVGNNGVMLYMSGDSWLVYPKTTEEDIHSVFLTGKESGWAVGSKGTILMLEGKDWYSIQSPTRATLYDVSFHDSIHGIAVGANGTILRYDNGIWSKSDNITKGILHSVSSYSGLNFLSGGMEYGSVPILTYDPYGNGFSDIFDPGYVVIKDISMQSDGQGWAVGTAGTLLHFNGTEWNREVLQEKVPTLNSLSFINSSDGIAVGFFGTLLKYTDTGWERVSSPSNVTFNGSAITNNAYYIVGNNGTILSAIRKSSTDELTGELSPYSIMINSYPNPAVEYVDIIIPEMDARDALILSILSSDGRVIQSINIEPGMAGNKLRFDTSSISNGLYLISIQSSENETAYGKFIKTSER